MNESTRQAMRQCYANYKAKHLEKLRKQHKEYKGKGIARFIPVLRK